MSKILVNNAVVIDGEFTFDLAIGRGEDQPLNEISGILTTEAGYLSPLESLENERYLLKGIHVYQCKFGSEEDTIAYYFTAKSYGMDNKFEEVKISGQKEDFYQED